MVLELTGVIAAKRAARMAEQEWPDDDAIRSAKLTEGELLQPVPERVWAMRNAAGAPLFLFLFLHTLALAGCCFAAISLLFIRAIMPSSLDAIPASGRRVATYMLVLS